MKSVKWSHTAHFKAKNFNLPAWYLFSAGVRSTHTPSPSSPPLAPDTAAPLTLGMRHRYEVGNVGCNLAILV